MLAQQKIVLRKNKGLVGKTMKVLVDSVGRKGEVVARHAGQAPDIDGRVLVSKSGALPGEIVEVKVSDFNYYDLMGTVVKKAAAEQGEGAALLKRKRMSLPVLGAVNTSVEVKGKRG
jgi:ribosomal protein S12 methylthiotransferase